MHKRGTLSCTIDNLLCGCLTSPHVPQYTTLQMHSSAFCSSVNILFINPTTKTISFINSVSAWEFDRFWLVIFCCKLIMVLTYKGIINVCEASMALEFVVY